MGDRRRGTSRFLQKQGLGIFVENVLLTEFMETGEAGKCMRECKNGVWISRWKVWKTLATSGFPQNTRKRKVREKVAYRNAEGIPHNPTKIARCGEEGVRFAGIPPRREAGLFVLYRTGLHRARAEAAGASIPGIKTGTTDGSSLKQVNSFPGNWRRSPGRKR